MRNPEEPDRLHSIAANPRRVAIAHAETDHFYGSERVMLDALSALRGAGHEVRVYLPGPGPFLERVRGTGVEPVILPFRLGRLRRPNRTWLAPVRAFARLRRDRIELLHCTSLSPLAPFLPAARLLGIPIVAQAQTPYDRQTLRRSFCRAADLLLPVSEACARPLRELIGSNFKRRPRVLSPIIHAPDPEAADRGRALRERWGFAPDQVVIGYLGQLIPRKGVDLLLRALSLLSTDGRALKVIVSGGDPASGEPTRAALEDLAAELGLADSLRFTGVVDDPAAYLAAMDIQVMPSRREGLGLVAGEGMLAGCAVIGSAVDGIPEIVIDGVTGLLVPPENPEALAEAIDRLIANPDLRRRLAAKGEERVRDIHSPLRFDSDLLAVVEQLLASR